MSINQGKNPVIPLVVSPEAVRSFNLNGKVCEEKIGGVPHLVHFVPCTGEVRDAYMRPLQVELKEAERQKRCPVRGKHGKLIRCPDGTKCYPCPYGNDPDNRMPMTVSLDKMMDSGRDQASHCSLEDDSLTKIRCEESVKKLLAVDGGKELAFVFVRLTKDATREEIATLLGKSVRRVGDLIQRIRDLLYDDWHD